MQINSEQEIILCDGKLPTMVCECGRIVTRKNISTHRKRPIHHNLMQTYISGLDHRVDDADEELPVNALEVAKVLNKSKISLLPQPVQDLIYEFAADMTAKNQFIKAVPQLFKYSNQPSIQKNLVFTFYKHQFSIYYPDGYNFLITPINGLEELSEHVYKYAKRWWVHQTEYDVNDKMGSLFKILPSTFTFPRGDVLDVLTAKSFQLVYLNGMFNDDNDRMNNIPEHLRHMIYVN